MELFGSRLLQIVRHVSGLLLIVSTLSSCGWMSVSLSSNEFEVVLRADSTKPYSNTPTRTFNFDVIGATSTQYEYRLNPVSPQDPNEPWSVVSSAIGSTSSLELTGLSEGPQLLQLRAISQDGTISKTTSFSWDVDMTPPTVTAHTGPTGLSNQTAASFTFSATDNTGGVGVNHLECRFDGIATWNNCSSPYSLAPLLNGNHTLAVRAIDKAGNVSSEVQYTWEVDILPPKIVISTPITLRGGGLTGSVSWRLTEKNVAASSSFTLDFFDGSSWTALGTIPAVAGANTNQLYSLNNFSVPNLNISNARIRIHLEDAVGNETEALSSVFPVEITPPTIASLDMELADGAPITYSPDINVALSVNSPYGVVTGIMLSEDPIFSGVTWDTYTPEKIVFRLSNLSGTKTVYAKVRTYTGLESNVVSKDIEYQTENPPVVTWEGPLTSTSISPSSGAVTLSWSCSSSGTLPANPIKSLMYSADDGVNYHTIATDLPNNDSPTAGHLNWTAPSMTPFGVLITATTPLKFRAFCRSTAGLINGVESEVYNSAWKIYAGGSNLQDNIHISAAILDRTPLFADQDNNLYFLKNSSALMRVDRKTGVVTAFFGELQTQGCNTNQLSNAKLLSLSANKAVAYVTSGLTGSCPRLYKINLSTGAAPFQILPHREVIDGLEEARIHNDRYYIYYQDKTYKFIDLSNPSEAPKKIVGQEGLCGAVSSIGTPAEDSLLPCSANTTFTVSRDGTKIWFGPSASNFGLEGSFTAGFNIKFINKPEMNSIFRNCVPNVSDSQGKTWMCPGSTTNGNKIVILDEETESIVSQYQMVGFKNVTGFRINLGTGTNSIYAVSTVNELFELKYQDGTWQQSTVMSNPLMTTGNGTDLKKVVFTDIDDLLWDDTTSALYIRGANHLRRFSYNIPAMTLNSVSTAVNSTVMNNSTTVTGLAINTAGTLIATHSFSNITRVMKSMDLTSFDPIAESILEGTPAAYNKSGSSTVFPAYGVDISFANSGNRSIYNRRLLMAYGGNDLLYFIGSSRFKDLVQEETDLTLFSTNGTTIRFVAGAAGAAQMAPAGTGNALNNPLKEVIGLQRASDGNLWLIDDYRLKKITILDSTPQYVDTIDYSLLPNYPSTIHNWTHAKYHESSGWTYFALAQSESADGKGHVWAAHPVHGWQELPMSGLSIGARPASVSNDARVGDLRLEISPFGLLLLDTYNRRILLHDLL